MKKLDIVLRVIAFVSIFVFGIAAAANAIAYNNAAAHAYVCAAAWAVIYLVEREEKNNG